MNSPLSMSFSCLYNLTVSLYCHNHVIPAIKEVGHEVLSMSLGPDHKCHLADYAITIRESSFMHAHTHTQICHETFIISSMLKILSLPISLSSVNKIMKRSSYLKFSFTDFFNMNYFPVMFAFVILHCNSI